MQRLSAALRRRFSLAFVGHRELARIVFWAALVGFAGAMASVVFRESLRLLELLFTGQATSLVNAAARLPWWHRALLPALGGLLAGLVLQLSRRTYKAPRAVDYMEAVLVGNGRISVRASVWQSVSSLLTISCGGSIGREGPMVQLAAMLGSRLGTLIHAPIPRLRLMVACGGAAGIAAAYNAPISGALFIAEIVLGSTAMESFGPLVVSSVISSATIHRFLGYGPVYDVPAVQFASNWELICFVVLGVLLGHLAPPFLALIDLVKASFVRLRLPLYAQLALGGLCVGVISILAPQVWGNGYSTVGRILHGQIFGSWLAVVLLAKLLATALTVGSGAVGGVFTPTLFIGCAVGALVGEGVHAVLPAVTSVPAAYALIGMGGFLAATTQAPLTSILMLFEMTGDYAMVLPLMLACVAAHYVAKVYRRGKSVYDASLRQQARQQESGPARIDTIETLLRPVQACTTPDAPVRALLDGLGPTPPQSIYLVDAGVLVAWLDARAAMERLMRGELNPETPVRLCAQPVSFALQPQMSLGTALDGFIKESASVLPVTSGQWANTLVGEVSRHDVLLAIQDQLSFRESPDAQGPA